MLKFRMHCEWRSMLAVLVVILMVGQFRSFAQSGESPNSQASAADQPIPPAVQKELAAMEKRIEQLEAELKSKNAPAQLSESAKSEMPKAAEQSMVSSSAPVDAAATSSQDPNPGKPAKEEPFAFADWTWLNGNARTKTAAFDSAFG